MKTKFYFFSGKGGVGKTTMSAATAVYFANKGKKTLIITTDPASNLADVFEQKIGHKITPIKNCQNLFAMELDPDKATADYKEKILAPLRGLIPEESFAVLEEQLNSPCTAEMASFDRFTDFVQDSDFEVVIFDTAPTGHTLRLLELPVEWSGVIEKASREGAIGDTCIGPAAALTESKAKFDRAIATMRDSKQTTFVFVLRPEATPLYEVKRSIAELVKLEIKSQALIVNAIYPKEVCDNPFMLARYIKQQMFLSEIKKTFNIPITLMKLESHEIKGVNSLQKTGILLFDNPLRLQDFHPDTFVAKKIDEAKNYKKIDLKIKKLLVPHNGSRRAIFFAGKGGVGKTSITAATGLWVAHQGFKTLIVTTDPASHLGKILNHKATGKPTLIAEEKNLWIAQIDAKEAVIEYKEKILNEARKKYDQSRILAIEEELNSPCTEEMAIFEKFIEFATRKDFEVVIFDTAPTGHTIRLLELPVSWSKQLEIKTFTSTGETEVDKAIKSKFKEVIAMMQDKNQTTFSFVMYPELTPIEEAARAIAELKTIGISTSLIVANLILPSDVITNDYWKKRKEMQDHYLKVIKKRFNAPIVTLPLMSDDLIGKEKLNQAGLLLYGDKQINKIIFVCAENAGRSLMAQALFNKYAKQKGIDWIAESAGTFPADNINRLVVEAMAEKGINLKMMRPKLFNHEKANEYARIISFGCLVKGSFSPEIQSRIEEWHIDDPKNQPLDKVRQIRDQIENKVIKLLNNL